MATITIQIDKETDLPALRVALDNLGLKYEVAEEDEWGDLSETQIESIQAGMEDIEAGRLFTQEEVMIKVNETLDKLRSQK